MLYQNPSTYKSPKIQENINRSSSNLNQHITMIYMNEEQNDELVHQNRDQNKKQKCENPKQSRNKTFHAIGRWTQKQKWQHKQLQMKMIMYIMWTWSNNESKHTKISNDNVHDVNLSEERSTKSDNDQWMPRNVCYWQREGLIMRTRETMNGKWKEYKETFLDHSEKTQCNRSLRQWNRFGENGFT